MASLHIETLEAHVQGTSRVSELEIKIALAHLASEVRERYANGSPSSVEFFRATHNVTARLRGQAYADLRLQCMWQAALFFYINGLGSEAISVARSMNLLATRSGDKRWERKANTALGIAFADLGNLVDAIRHNAIAYEIACTIEEPVGEFSALGNLGSAFNYAALYEDAIPCFERALWVADHKDMSACAYDTHATVLCNMAQSYLYLGRSKKAFSTISKAISSTSEPIDSFSALQSTVRWWTFGLVMLELGRLDEADSCAKACGRYASMSGTVKGKFLSEMFRALCMIHRGEVSAGLEILESFTSTMSSSVDSVRADALRGLVKAYDTAGLPDRALGCLQELLSYIKRARTDALNACVNNSVPILEGLNEVADSHFGTLVQTEATLRAKVAESKLFTMQYEVLERLAVAAELKDDPSGAHGFRVGRWSRLIAQELGWDRSACHVLETAARLHDIGKIALPDKILFASNELRIAERSLMQSHAIIGAELLSKSVVPDLRIAEDIARFHHEWWDGSGYPSKLSGKQIPIHARIVAIADVFDALTHGRPYAETLSFNRALEHVLKMRSSQFDPQLMDLFLPLARRIKDEHDDIDAFFARGSKISPLFEARSKIKALLAGAAACETRSVAA